MPAPPELAVKQLRRCWSATDFKFETTAALPPLEGLIGQERAVKGLEFGLGMRAPGYNIFVAGPAGTGKTSYTRALVSRRARAEDKADDWVYVYNFDRPDEPQALSLPAGTAQAFARNVQETVADALAALTRALDSREHQKKQRGRVQKTQAQIQATVAELAAAADQRGFALRQTEAGFVPVPVSEGQSITEEMYAGLDETTRKRIARDAEELNTAITAAVRQIYELQKELQERLRAFDRQVATVAITPVIERLTATYPDAPRVLSYLQRLGADLIEHQEGLRSAPAQEQGEESAPELPLPIQALHPRPVDLLARYRVNVLCTRDGDQGAPVVVETNPTYTNLFGKVETGGPPGEQPLGGDITGIRAGSIHRANGGYLILQAPDVLQNPFAWESLKRALSNREVRIEVPPELLRVMPPPPYRPEPIPLHVKVILIGPAPLYHLLYAGDDTFHKLFKLRAEFDTVMPATPENVRGYAEFIAHLCRRDNLCHLNAAAVGRVLEYSHRLADDQDKLSTQFNEVVDILYEACTWAGMARAGEVDDSHVEQAIAGKKDRSRLAEDRTYEYIQRGQVLIDTEGDVVGQVNGLSVLRIGDHSFGAPSRITAAVHLGQQGIIHIERETRMSGQIHDKGVLTLAGFLGERFAQMYPLSLSASLSFEQQYFPVEGDSASCAELYALLSALAAVPVHQGIAVTGSVNQRGQVQPIGGVNEKVEGFFHICRLKGLTGRQGVMIPVQNVVNLMLNADVVAAVAAGQFHIWAVSCVDEGIEILTGIPAGARDADGVYPADAINGRVSQRLEAMARGLAVWWRQADAPAGAGGATVAAGAGPAAASGP